MHVKEGEVDEYIVIGGVYVSKRGGTLFGIVWRIILSRKNRSVNKLDFVDYIIKYLKTRRVGRLERPYMGKSILTI